MHAAHLPSANTTAIRKQGEQGEHEEHEEQEKQGEESMDDLYLLRPGA